MLRNAVMGGVRVSNFPEKSVTKVYGSMLLAFHEVVGINFPVDLPVIIVTPYFIYAV